MASTQKVDITADILISIIGIDDMHGEVRRQLRIMIDYLDRYGRLRELVTKPKFDTPMSLSVLLDERGTIRDIDLTTPSDIPMVAGRQAKPGTWFTVACPRIHYERLEAVTNPKSYIDESGKRRFPKGVQVRDAILSLAESRIVGNDDTVDEIVRYWRRAAPGIINGLYGEKVSKAA